MLPFPNHSVQIYELRIASLLMMPVVLGLIMSFRRTHLEGKGKIAIRVDRFFNAYLLALGFGAIRFCFGK
ncbi:hypothetical protein EBZ37_10990 [bacterium]|nr:hypothetical protein [bacterium]